jgi:hypothetical protein
VVCPITWSGYHFFVLNWLDIVGELLHLLRPVHSKLEAKLGILEKRLQEIVDFVSAFAEGKHVLRCKTVISKVR